MSKPSRGFIALELEVLEADVSMAAAWLLLQLRKESATRETDGAVDERMLAAAAAYAALSPAATRRAVAELLAKGLLVGTGAGYEDTGYLLWNTPHERREQKRADTRRRVQKHRDGQRFGANPDPNGAPDVTRYVTRYVTRDVTDLKRSSQEQEQEQEQERGVAPLLALPLPAAPRLEGDGLRPDDEAKRAEAIATCWADLTGGPARKSDAVIVADFDIPLAEILSLLRRHHCEGTYSLRSRRMRADLQVLESDVRRRRSQIGPRGDQRSLAELIQEQFRVAR